MPLNTGPTAKDKSNVPQHANRTPAAQPRAAQRSMTPQPNSGRERTVQIQDDSRRKSHGPMQAKENFPPPTLKEANALRLPVPDTRPKSKLSQSVATKPAQRPAVAQHDVYANHVPATNEAYNV